MIKLSRLHTRQPAVHSRLSFGPCRMIGGQDLLRRHNSMLTLVIWPPSTSHCRPSMDPHIRSKPLYALRMEIPCLQIRKPSFSAGQSISKVSSATDALCRSLHWPRSPRWTRSWSWMTHPLVKRSRKLQCSWRWASHLALMIFQQKSVSTGEKPCLISFRICSPTVGRMDSSAGPQGCSHCLSVQKQGRKIWLLKLSRHHPTLHCRQASWLTSCWIGSSWH